MTIKSQITLAAFDTDVELDNGLYLKYRSDEMFRAWLLAFDDRDHMMTWPEVRLLYCGWLAGRLKNGEAFTVENLKL